MSMVYPAATSRAVPWGMSRAGGVALKDPQTPHLRPSHFVGAQRAAPPGDARPNPLQKAFDAGEIVLKCLKFLED